VNVRVPQFDKAEVDKIADLIEQKYLADAEESVDLFVNGRYVPLDRSGKNLLLRTLTAIASGLKVAEQLRRLSIFMRRKS
jgi:N12 class adenine-specific DNA methylase